MKEPLILIGGGGHCRSCIDVIEAGGEFSIAGILDLPEHVGMEIMGYRVSGTDSDLPSLIPKVRNYLITVGQIKSSAVRQELFRRVKEAGGRLPVIISPHAHVARTARLGEGTVIMHHAIINADATVGAGCIINTRALIEHEAVIGDFTHVSTAAVINGQAAVGSNCFIGSNTVVANNISITDDVILSAGSIVLRDVTTGGTYMSGIIRKLL